MTKSFKIKANKIAKALHVFKSFKSDNAIVQVGLQDEIRIFMKTASATVKHHFDSDYITSTQEKGNHVYQVATKKLITALSSFSDYDVTVNIKTSMKMTGGGRTITIPCINEVLPKEHKLLDVKTLKTEDVKDIFDGLFIVAGTGGIIAFKKDYFMSVESASRYSACILDVSLLQLPEKITEDKVDYTIEAAFYSKDFDLFRMLINNNKDDEQDIDLKISTDINKDINIVTFITEANGVRTTLQLSVLDSKVQTSLLDSIGKASVLNTKEQFDLDTIQFMEVLDVCHIGEDSEIDCILKITNDKKKPDQINIVSVNNLFKDSLNACDKPTFTFEFGTSSIRLRRVVRWIKSLEHPITSIGLVKGNPILSISTGPDTYLIACVKTLSLDYFVKDIVDDKKKAVVCNT
jgi:hypothetical protein